MEIVAPQTPPQKSNKVLLWLGIIIGALTLLGLIALALTLVSAPEATPIDKTTGEKEISYLDKSLVPEAENFKLERPDESAFAILSFTAGASAENYIIEYRIQNGVKEILDEGIVKAGEEVVFKPFLTNGSNIFTVKFRISDEVMYSEWVIVGEDEIILEGLPEGSPQNSQAEPNPEYFHTKWAAGEGGSENFNEAMRVAWNATPVTADDYCMPLNSSTVQAGEIVPPIPSVVPAEVKLKFYADVNEVAATLTFYWCGSQ